MRACSSFANSLALDWRRAGNFVAKRYKKSVPDQLYFADVKLQMDAKRMGELYNQTDPPKKIDVMMVCHEFVLQLVPQRYADVMFVCHHCVPQRYVGFIMVCNHFVPQRPPL